MWLLVGFTALLGAVNLVGMDVKSVSSVPYATALEDAMKVASLHDDWEVMRAAGVSMNPFYNGDSIIILDRSKFSELSAGMIVIYTDREGELVGHTIIRRSDQGWIAKGLNNDVEDPVLVTEDNYVGTLFGVFNTSGALKDPSLLAAIGADRMHIVIGKEY